MLFSECPLIFDNKMIVSNLNKIKKKEFGTKRRDFFQRLAAIYVYHSTRYLLSLTHALTIDTQPRNKHTYIRKSKRSYTYNMYVL